MMNLMLLPMLATLLSATNPDYNFVGIIEIFTLFSALSVICFYRGRVFLSRYCKYSMLALGIALGVLLTRLAYTSWTLARPEIKPCLLLGSEIEIFECLIYLPSSVYPGFRQMLFHITALSVFCAFVFGGASKINAHGDNFPWPIVAAPLVLILAQIYYFICGYISSSGDISDFSRARNLGAVIFTNPGWVWPFFLSALSASTWMVLTSRTTTGRFFSGILFIASIWMCLLTGQRGALALLFTCLLALLISVLMMRRWAKFSFQSNLKIFGVIVAAFTALSLLSMKIVPLMVSSYKLKHFLKSERSDLWKIGIFNALNDQWIVGTGYGTWFTAIRPYTRKLRFDTAHNLWVQMLVELGMLHMVTLLLLFGFVAIWGVKQSFRRSLADGAAFLLLILGGICCTFLQELDYINTVYYHFAAMVGFLFGRGAALCDVNFLEKRKEPKVGRIIWSASIFLAGSLCTLFLYTQFSWGGYAFDKNGKELTFLRWFRPEGQIVNHNRSRHGVYTVYPMFNKSGSISFMPDEVYASEGHLYFKNGEDFLGQRFDYRSSNFSVDGRRRLSFQLLLRPLQTSMVFLSESGLYDFEPSDLNDSVRWCQAICKFTLKTNDCLGKKLQLRVRAPRPDISDSRPLNIVVKFSDSPEFGTKELHMTLREADKDYWIDLTQDRKPVALPIQIQILSSHTYNPAKVSISADNRDLAVQLGGIECR